MSESVDKRRGFKTDVVGLVGSDTKKDRLVNAV